MSRTIERLVALAAIMVVASGGYWLSEVSTCEAINEAHAGTQVFLDEFVDAAGPLSPENQDRVERIETKIQPRDCGWTP